jgi:hypothetical protein
MKQNYVFFAINAGGVVVARKLVKSVPDELFMVEYSSFKSEHPAQTPFFMSEKELDELMRNLKY